MSFVQFPLFLRLVCPVPRFLPWSFVQLFFIYFSFLRRLSISSFSASGLSSSPFFQRVLYPLPLFSPCRLFSSPINFPLRSLSSSRINFLPRSSSSSRINVSQCRSSISPINVSPCRLFSSTFFPSGGVLWMQKLRSALREI